MNRKRLALRVFLVGFLSLYLISLCYAIIHVKVDPRIVADFTAGVHSSQYEFLGMRNHYAGYFNEHYIVFYPWYNTTNNQFYCEWSTSSDFITWNVMGKVATVFYAGLGSYNVAGSFAMYPATDDTFAFVWYEEDWGVRYRYGLMLDNGAISWGSTSRVFNQTAPGDSRPYLDVCVASDMAPWVSISFNDPATGWVNTINRGDYDYDGMGGLHWYDFWTNDTWEPFGASLKHKFSLVPFTNGRVYSFAYRDGWSTDTVMGTKWSVTVSRADNVGISLVDAYIDGNGADFPQFSVVGESIHERFSSSEDDYIHYVFKQPGTGDKGNWYYKRYDASTNTWNSSVSIYDDVGASDFLIHPALSIVRPTHLQIKMMFSAFHYMAPNGDIIGFEYNNSTGWGSIETLGDSLMDGWVSNIRHGDLASMPTVDTYRWGQNSTIGIFWHNAYLDEVDGLLTEWEELWPREPIPWEVRYFIIGILGILFMIGGTTYGGYKISKGEIPEGIGWGFVIFVIGVGLLVTWLWDRIAV